MKMAWPGAMAEQEQGDQRHGQRGEAKREAAGRLLALQHEGGREDRVGEEDHATTPGRLIGAETAWSTTKRRAVPSPNRIRTA